MGEHRSRLQCKTFLPCRGKQFVLLKRMEVGRAIQNTLLKVKGQYYVKYL